MIERWHQRVRAETLLRPSFTCYSPAVSQSLPTDYGMTAVPRGPPLSFAPTPFDRAIHFRAAVRLENPGAFVKMAPSGDRLISNRPARSLHDGQTIH